MKRIAWTILLAACGGSSSEVSVSAAREALTTGDYAQALETADAGLGLAADATQKWGWEALRLEALAGLGDAAGTKAALERLGGTNANQLNIATYAKLLGTAKSAGHLLLAIDILDAGAKRFPDQKAAFDSAIAELKLAAEGDDEATERLKSLGYL